MSLCTIYIDVSWKFIFKIRNIYYKILDMQKISHKNKVDLGSFIGLF